MSWGLREQEETRSMFCCMVLSYSIEKACSSEIELQHEECMQRTGFSARPQPYFPSFLLSHHHSSLHFSLKPHSGAQAILTSPSNCSEVINYYDFIWETTLDYFIPETSPWDLKSVWYWFYVVSEMISMLGGGGDGLTETHKSTRRQRRV